MTTATATRHAVLDSPIGPLTLTERDGHLAGVHMEEHRHAPASFGDRDDAVLPAVREQLLAYFARELEAFDLPLAEAPGATSFQREVWAALREIPYGQTWSYGDLAAHIGRPKAVRAVGLANGRNPISIVVPCHRVIGASGSLTGYGGGVERKRFLLDLERGALA
jgi:methylated-DNA-[protein]-cysteine S-methyltransferase